MSCGAVAGLPCMKQITPCLWFDGNAEDAAALYTSIFPDSAVTGVQRYGPDSPGVAGTVMVVEFRLRPCAAAAFLGLLLAFVGRALAWDLPGVVENRPSCG